MLYHDENGNLKGWDWLQRQEAYQQETFGVDFEVFAAAPEKLTAYTTMNLNAAFLELAEAQAETPWKPWATVDKEEVWVRNRDKFVGELVDVLFFLGNSLIAVGCTDEELATRYAEKMQVNVDRQLGGYDGFSTKCPACQRAIDDCDPEDTVETDERVYCSEECAIRDFDQQLLGGESVTMVTDEDLEDHALDEGDVEEVSS